MKGFAKILKPQVAFLIVILFALTVFAQQPLISFGPRDDPKSMQGLGFERSQGLKVDAGDIRGRGQAVLRDQSTLRQTGGGLLVSTAEPHPTLVGHRIKLAYVRKNMDGRRVQVAVGGREPAFMDLYDWELKPLAEFADSQLNGAIHMTPHRSGGKKIELHDAFQGRLLGLRMIQADVMPRGYIASQRYLPRSHLGLLLGEGEKQHLGKEETVQEAERALSDLFKANTAGWNVLTDAGVKFTYSVDGDRFVVSGRPYVFAWDEAKGTVEKKTAIINKFKEEWETLRKLNPIVVRSIERTFRTVALFRYQIKYEKQNWDDFFEQVKQIELEQVRTPKRIVRSR